MRQYGLRVAKVEQSQRGDIVVAVLLLAAISGAGCELPTGPSRLPNVAGVYTGTGSITLDADHLARWPDSRVTTPFDAELEVTQHDDQVSMTYTMYFENGHVEYSPTLTGVINADGRMHWPGGLSEDSLSCGIVRTSRLTVHFSGRTVRLEVVESSPGCGGYRATIEAERT